MSQNSEGSDVRHERPSSASFFTVPSFRITASRSHHQPLSVTHPSPFCLLSVSVLSPLHAVPSRASRRVNVGAGSLRLQLLIGRHIFIRRPTPAARAAHVHRSRARATQTGNGANSSRAAAPLRPRRRRRAAPLSHRLTGAEVYLRADEIWTEARASVGGPGRGVFR